MVVRAHRRVKGIDPVTGKQYDAANVDEQVWVHSVAWHSYMAAYRAYAGRLTEQEQDRYLAEGVAAATMIGVPAERVPASVADLRDYWATMRPQLCVGAYGRELIDFVLHPTFPTELLPFVVPYSMLVRLAVAIIPRDLRSIMGMARARCCKRPGRPLDRTGTGDARGARSDGGLVRRRCSRAPAECSREGERRVGSACCMMEP